MSSTSMRSGSGFSLGATPAGDVGWQAPVSSAQFRGLVGSLGYMGSATAATLGGILADPGSAWVVSVADGVGALASAAVGDVWEPLAGGDWVRIHAGVGGFVASDVALVANSADVLVAPLTNGVDEDKLCRFDGTSLSPADKTSGAAGDSVAVRGNGSRNAGQCYVYTAGSGWGELVAASGGYVAAGTRFVAHPTLVCYPLVAADYGKIVQFAGGSDAVTLTTPADGWAVLIAGETHPSENTALEFDGTVPTGEWAQLSATDASAIHDNVAGEIAAIAVKAAPVGADIVLIEDSAAANAKKYATLSSVPLAGALGGTLGAATVDDGADGTAIHDNVAGEIAAIAAKAVPVAADFVIVEDSAAGNVKKSITIGTIPLGGDAGGTLATVTIGDLTIASETKGDGLFFDGSGWERLAAGAAGTVLTGNGVGAMPSYAAAAGGLVNFTEARNTTTENAVVLSPVTTLDNIVFNMGGSAPTWDGFLVGIDSDGTATGGNARGSGAIELGNAVGRTLATQVASGAQSAIVGGQQHQSSGLRSTVVGGVANAVTGEGSIVCGGTLNVAQRIYSGIFGGSSNLCRTNDYGAILGGTFNDCSGSAATIAGGTANIANGNYSFVGGGSSNDTTNAYAVVVGGTNNLASGSSSGVFSAASSTASGLQCVVVGGSSNIAGGAITVVIGGATNTTSNAWSAAIGGSLNTVSGQGAATIGSYTSSASQAHSVVIGGFFNAASALASVAMGYSALSDHPTGLAISGNLTGFTAERGQSQLQVIHLDGTTSGAVTVNLASNSFGVAPDPREIEVPLNGALSYTGTITAWNETDGTVNSWLVSGTCSNPAGTPALAGNTETAMAAAHAATLAVSVVSAATDLLRFAGTGIAAKTIRWSAALTLSRAAT